MKDCHGGIIYVGKAKNLKRRVQSYFQHLSSHSPKTNRLIKNIKDFDFILTDTEFEAFMLECKLIKEIKPFFNKKMKNPQSYTFITIDMGQELPVIEVSGDIKFNQSTLSFGPFMSRNTVVKAIHGLKEFYQIDCNNLLKRKTPCLNYSIGLCIGMCFQDTAAKQYQSIVHKIIQLLKAEDMSILDEIKQTMMQAADNLDFAAAAKYRDHLDAIKFLLYKEEVIGFTEENNNIAVIESLLDDSFKFFLIKRNLILFSQKLPSDTLQAKELIKESILVHFRKKETNSCSEVSKEEIDEAQIIFSYLKGGACRYTIIPERWLDAENANLEDAIEKLLGQSPAPLT